jgi:glutamine synthetase
MSMDVTGRDVEETGLIWDIGDADRVLWPVPGTLKRVPWALEPQAQYLGSFHEIDGAPSLADPRHALLRIIERFKELRLTPVAAVELEFYLLDRDSALAGAPKPPKGLSVPAEQRHFQGYYLQDLDDFAPYFRDLYAAAKLQGLPLEALLSEYSPGQMEIGLRYRPNALQACDEAIQFKRLVKGVAERHGMIASFMAKPYSVWTGCGMHLHVSLADEAGRNIFASDADVIANEHLRHAIGGMKATMADAMAIFAPNANSYRRFRKSSYAPIAPNWGFNNRTVSLRIPATPGPARHVEHRAPGADANPYLALAAVLAGVHHGLVNKTDPGPPVEGTGYTQPADPMPTNWFAALEKLRASSFLNEYFGARFIDVFATLKEIEADRFFAEPQPLDFEYYLRSI